MFITLHIKFANFIFSDIDEYYYACSQCAWSDRTTYTERKVKQWPDGEPSNPKVNNKMFHLLLKHFRNYEV